MAAPSGGTEVPCSPQCEESPHGDRPSPAGATELAAAEATAGVAVATIAPLAPEERGGMAGVSGKVAATGGVGKKKASRNASRSATSLGRRGCMGHRPSNNSHFK